MTPFADTNDLAVRWRPLTPHEVETATAMIEDASAMIRAACPGIDERLTADPPALDPAIPRMVACAVVKRAMITAGGVSAEQTTSGPFSQSLTFSNPSGDLYLTKAERKMLGCGGQRAFSIDLAPDAGVPSPINDYELG